MDVDHLEQEFQRQYLQARSDMERVDLLNQYADAFYRQEQFERARGLCVQARDLAGVAGENQQPYLKGLANSLTLLGSIDLYVSSGDQLLSLFMEALTLLEQVHDPACLAKALRSISWVYFCGGEYVTALDYINRAIAAAEACQDIRQIGPALTSAAAILAESGDLEQAIPMLQRAIQMLDETNTPRELGITYNNLAMTLIQLGRLTEAEEAGLEGLRLITPLNTAVSEATVLDTLGLVYKEQGNLQLAAEYFQKAAQRTPMRPGTGADLEPYLHLGEVWLKAGALPQAEQNLLYALQFAEKYGMLRFVYRCHEKLAELYEQRADFQKALLCYRQFHLLKEKVYSQESLQQLANLKAMHKIETAVKDAEILQLRNAGLVQEIATEKARHAELEHLATTDALTGLFNRRHFFTLGAFEFSSVRAAQTDLCLIMIDIDHFKNVNDQYGHSIGDQVLIRVGAVLNNCLRSQDVFCRYGGEEFIALLPNTSLGAGMSIANRLLRQVSELQVPVGQQMIQVTISLGVAALDTGDPTLEQLIERADVALRQAKSSGRNTVVAHPGPIPRSAAL